MVCCSCRCMVAVIVCPSPSFAGDSQAVELRGQPSCVRRNGPLHGAICNPSHTHLLIVPLQDQGTPEMDNPEKVGKITKFPSLKRCKGIPTKGTGKRTESHKFQGIFRAFAGYFRGVSGYLQGVFRVFFPIPFRVCPLGKKRPKDCRPWKP